MKAKWARDLFERRQILGASAALLALLTATDDAVGDPLSEKTEALAASSIAITLTDAGCQPALISVRAGSSSFLIQNDRKGEGEWEILKDDFVVDETEHIPAGALRTLTAKLDAGAYDMVCGLLSSPMGALKVAATEDAPAKPSLIELIGPLAEYKLYVKGETDALVSRTQLLVRAVKANRLDEARRLYAPAHLHYERIEPIAELFSDLDGSMDSREDDFEKKAADPKFLGFHRIEKGLFADRSTAGLTPTADKLMADAKELQSRIEKVTVAPKDLVGGAADLIEEVASKKIVGEEDRYSRTDLWDFQANLDGAEKIVSLLRSLIQKQDPALSARLTDNFSKIDEAIGKYKTPDGGFLSYEKLSDRDRLTLKGPITTLAEELSALKGALGVE
jgi:iron uptake system component EfeO